MALPVIHYATTLMRDLDAGRPAVQIPRDTLLEAIRLSTQEHTDEVNAAVRLFASDTSDRETSIVLGAEFEMQPLDELGEPEPVKGGAEVSLGFPIDDHGIRFDLSFKARQEITAQELSDRVEQMQRADASTIARKLLASLFSNVSRSHKEPNKPPQTIKYLANGDGDSYALRDGGDSQVSHYTAQGDPISDLNNPYPAIEERLGSRAINADPYIVFIASNLSESTRLLDGFASARSSVVEPAAPTFVLTEQLANQDVALSSTMAYLGAIGNLHVVQWSRLPAGYMIGLAAGDAERRPLRKREYATASLRGLITAEETNEFPFFKNRFLRFVGFGGYNRVGACVHRVGNASYAIPAGYTDPFSAKR